MYTHTHTHISEAYPSVSSPSNSTREPGRSDSTPGTLSKMHESVQLITISCPQLTGPFFTVRMYVHMSCHVM